MWHLEKRPTEDTKSWLASLVKIGSVVSEISKGDISIFRRPHWRRIDLLNTIFKEDSSSKVWLNCFCGFGDLEYCRPKRSLLLSSRSQMHLNVSCSREGNSLIRSLFHCGRSNLIKWGLLYLKNHWPVTSLW